MDQCSEWDVIRRACDLYGGMSVLLREPLAAPKLEVSTLRYALARELDPKSGAMFGMRPASAFTN